MNNLISGLSGLIITAIVIIALPIASIWSLNTLFDLGIEYTWHTWLAMLVLMGALMAGGSK